MADAKTADAVKNRFDVLKSERGVWEDQWEDIAILVHSRRRGFNTTPVPGEKVNQQVFDSTAPWANEQLASALHGMLTNPALRWFQLKTKIKELMDDQEVALWLDAVEQDLFDTFADPEANFNSQAHELYLDLGAFGTAVMVIEETPGFGPGLRFMTYFLGNCVVAENSRGLVDTLYRKEQFTARQIKQAWPDTAGDKIEKQIKEDPDKKFFIIHEVMPREDRDVALEDGMNKPFSSTYVLEDHKIVLGESGFDYFPYLVPRWYKMSGDIYGRSPSMTALSDIKMLNEMCKTSLKSAQKQVDPPLLVPDDGFFLPLVTTPAGLNFYRSGTLQQGDKLVPLETKGNVGLGLDMENQRRESILRIFFQDRLKLQKEKIEMTRAEAVIRDQENLRMMSPTIGRLEMEFLNLLITTTFNIRQSQGKLPPAPDILVENAALLDIEYQSPIARAQRSGEGEAVNAAISLLAPVVTAGATEIMDNFDGDEIARSTKDWFGYPAKLLQSKAKVRQMRIARAQQIALQEEKEAEERLPKAAANLAKAAA